MAAFAAMARRLWPWLAGAAGLAVAGLLAAALMAGGAARRSAGEAAQARAGATISAGRETAAAAATGAVAAKGDRDLARSVETQENRDAILATDNAADGAGAAGDMGLERLCRRALYRDDADCARLRGEGAASTARRDAGRGAAGGQHGG